MHRNTLAVLEQLQKASWFSHVGAHDTTAAIILSSWRQAIAFCGSPEWEDLRLEMANQYCERIARHSKERFARWNEIVDGLKKTLVPLVREKIEPVVQQQNPPKAFEDSVRWDIIHLCMEMEYSDVVPPGFYAGLGSWYIRGHFPCRWRGVFPEGMEIIY
jgi:hypothetical protein